MSTNHLKFNIPEYNTSTRLLYALGFYTSIFILILPVFNIINHSPSMGYGFIYGLTTPIKSVYIFSITSLMGFFVALNKRLITQVTLAIVYLAAIIFSASINLYAEDHQLFRLLIFISIIYTGYVLDTREVNSLLITIFAFIGYLCGMSYGISLPKNVCCVNYLYGTIITNLLIMAGSGALGNVFAEYITEKLHHLKNYFRTYSSRQ